MPTLQAADIGDIVTTTLRDLGRSKFQDNATTYQDTVVMKRLIKKNKLTFDSGYEIQFNRMLNTGQSARMVGLFAQDVIDVTDVMGTGNAPWRHVTWNYALDFREPLMNAAPAKIVDLIRTRDISEEAGAIVLFEQKFWRVPASTNTTDIFGVPYWIVKSNTATSTNEGFNGTAHTGYTTVGGINPTSDTKWRNYATQYTTVSKNDLVRKMRRMAQFTQFKPIVADTPQYNRGDDKAYYSNYSVISVLEEILEAQNENLGNDIASRDGSVIFRRAPVEWVKELELDTTNPIYQINWGVFYAIGLRGAWMKKTVEPRVSGQHTVSAVHTDCTFNVVCKDRRRCGVLATTTGVDY